MFCENCGNELKEGATVCDACGTAVRAWEGAGPVPEAGTPGSIPEDGPVSASGDLQEGVSAGILGSASAGDLAGGVAAISGEAPGAASVDALESAQTGAKAARRPGKKKWIALAATATVAVIAGLFCLLYFTGDTYQCKKAMKLAAACLEEEEYRDALKHYKDALELDETQWEAYLGSAECYLAQGKYEDALKILKKGAKLAEDDEDGDAAEAYLEEASKEQEEAYVLGVDTLVGQADYSGAHSLLEEGIEETDSVALEKKRSEVYGAEAEYYIGQSDYETAFAVLQEGYEATQDTALLEKKGQVYLALAREDMAQGAYETALALLEEGYEATQDTALLEEKSQVYLAWADAFLPSDFQSAIQILESGIEATGSEALTERKAYVEENVRVTKASQYDSAGKLLRVGEYSPEGVLLRLTYYDRSGNLLNEITYDEAGNELSDTGYNSDGDVTCWCEYTYGWNGKVQSKVQYAVDWYGNTYISEKYTYDETGQERSYTHYYCDEYGDVYETMELTYDEYGNLLKSADCADGYYYWYVENAYTYDDSGHMMGSGSYDEYGDVTGWKEYVYDDSGHMLSEMQYNDDGSVWRREYTYDENGHVLRRTWYNADGSTGSWEEYTYDASGNVLSATEYDRDGQVEDSWEITYDSFGNAASRKRRDAYSELLGDDLDLPGLPDSVYVYYAYEDCTWTYEYAYTG